MTVVVRVTVGSAHWQALVTIAGPKPRALPFALAVGPATAVGALAATAMGVDVAVADGSSRLPILVMYFLARF